MPWSGLGLVLVLVFGCLLRMASVAAVAVLPARLYPLAYTVVPLALSFP
ncbi:TPA: hypothetical protein SMI16_004897 [Serratia liquefaciens]|nr:hypothetical protein [Serratia liquefaciens]